MQTREKVMDKMNVGETISVLLEGQMQCQDCNVRNVDSGESREIFFVWCLEWHNWGDGIFSNEECQGFHCGIIGSNYITKVPLDKYCLKDGFYLWNYIMLSLYIIISKAHNSIWKHCFHELNMSCWIRKSLIHLEYKLVILMSFFKWKLHIVVHSPVHAVYL